MLCVLDEYDKIFIQKKYEWGEINWNLHFCNNFHDFIHNIRLFNHDNINEFSYNYLDKFNTIEENVKDENWSKASDLLKTSKDNLEDEKILGINL